MSSAAAAALQPGASCPPRHCRRRRHGRSRHRNPAVPGEAALSVLQHPCAGVGAFRGQEAAVRGTVRSRWRSSTEVLVRRREPRAVLRRRLHVEASTRPSPWRAAPWWSTTRRRSAWRRTCRWSCRRSIRKRSPSTLASSRTRTARPSSRSRRCGRSTSENPIKRLIISTYQAASGAGAAAMEELRESTRANLEGRAYEPKVLPHPYAFNLFSHNTKIDPDTGYNEEETKVIQEARKIFGEPDLRDLRHVRARAGAARPLRVAHVRVRAAHHAERSARDSRHRAGRAHRR